jgi:hypothetical protein
MIIVTDLSDLNDFFENLRLNGCPLYAKWMGLRRVMIYMMLLK